MSQLERIIADEQQADGSFLSYSVPKGSRFDAHAKVYHTTFMPALIAAALVNLPGQSLAGVLRRTTDFLLAQRSPEWSFNYWTRTAAEAKTQPYPDDWDDTSCTIIALTQARPEAVTGEVLGRIVTLLTNTEMAEGGPYRTWIVPADAPQHWQDVDVAVNANIAYMLRLHGVDLPNLEQLATTAIAQGELASPYYPSAYPLEYFVSRWYQGSERERLRERVVARCRAREGNPLEVALAVSAALNLGTEPAAVAAAVAWLRGLKAAQVQPYAFCLDPAIAGQPYVAGSRALTAALCLEAIAKYETAVHPDHAPTPADSQAEAMHQRVVTTVMARFEQSGETIQTASQQMRDRLLGGTAAGQITLLPYLFRQALGKTGRRLSDDTIVALGAVSFYGWIAYTIYDDFLDEEGEPRLLPLANVALRELVLALAREAAEVPGFEAVAGAVLERQDAANGWEMQHCRVQHQRELLRVTTPDYADLHALAERSMGHALGCLAITMRLGYGAGSPQLHAVQTFFYHFLIARQLSDDISDWQEDLRKGQINAVAAHMLKGLGRRGQTVQGLYAQLSRHFWERALPELNARILNELAQARAALAAAKFIERPEASEVLLSPIEAATHQSEDQRRQTTEFLQAYKPG